MSVPVMIGVLATGHFQLRGLQALLLKLYSNTARVLENMVVGVGKAGGSRQRCGSEALTEAVPAD